MSNKQKNKIDTENDDLEEQEINDMLVNYFSQGGTLKNLKNMSDNSMETIYSMAYNLYNSEKYEEAKPIFQFLCFYDHFNKKYFMGLSSCQLMLKQYAAAVELFSFTAILDSTDPQPMMYLGDCYLKQNNKEKAKISYETCIEIGKKQSKYKACVEKAENMIKVC